MLQCCEEAEVGRCADQLVGTRSGLEGRQLHHQLHQLPTRPLAIDGQLHQVRVQLRCKAGEQRGWRRVEEEVLQNRLDQLHTASRKKKGKE